MWLQSSQRGDCRRDSRALCCTEEQGSARALPRGSKQGGQVMSGSATACWSRLPSGGRLQQRLLSRCKFERERVRCVTHKTHVHTSRSNRATWNAMIPLAVAHLDGHIYLHYLHDCSIQWCLGDKVLRRVHTCVHVRTYFSQRWRLVGCVVHFHRLVSEADIFPFITLCIMND